MNKIIFLPGASGDLRFWQPVSDLLPAIYSKEMIAYPGFGSVEANHDLTSFDDLIDYVVGKIQQECVIVAQSMGGIFAVAAALQKPELIKGLVLVATSGGIPLEPFQVQDWREGYHQHYSQYPDWFVTANINFEAELDSIKNEVLLLWGDHDPFSTPAVGEYLSQRFPHAELHIIHGGDHQFAHTYAQIVAVHINHYLNRIL
ncbi:alpha/beta hydrolase [Acinetobacter sp. NIPH 2699]|uniref:alpha/beta fold hydrolase n=1 Tax=Acinetobacter sp. NIPH 2699 TaxID=2923433 RepID=UPI001F4A55BF|nr:alpha/beta hydrolase [Acinetobacter sp. NIPH 2699]MCH7336069.1 alpha/beta hydrolase [Acinetobacter sp. NIPH 2699]